MTKKHFEAIARIIANLQVYGVPTSELREMIAQEFAKLCASENPRFNRATFFKACGLSEGELWKIKG